MPDVQETFDCAEKQVAETMDKARSHLIGAGFAPESVTMEIVKHAPSRSGAILKAAAAGNYSTIAMGRKGMSRVREFPIGRVSSKVLQIGQEFGVWIVQ
jgi:nucleotide-binding universal stress UspA family protein